MITLLNFNAILGKVNSGANKKLYLCGEAETIFPISLLFRDVGWELTIHDRCKFQFGPRANSFGEFMASACWSLLEVGNCSSASRASILGKEVPQW